MTASPSGHLVLIGMMGAGKTTVGARCAALLDRPFVDVDDIVEAVTGRTVREIFATDGEAAFRALEAEALRDACAAPEPSVIAAGGGAMQDPVNRRAVEQAGTVVWLRAEPDELARRVTADGVAERPMLAGTDAAPSIERLLAVRTAGYEGLADVVVDTDGRDVDAVAAEVARAVAA